ncbi:pilus assembly protein PilP [Reinekea thalattae]|nr:pilus assembly protein PilP [Reinekea thalattae]
MNSYVAALLLRRLMLAGLLLLLVACHKPAELTDLKAFVEQTQRAAQPMPSKLEHDRNQQPFAAVLSDRVAVAYRADQYRSPFAEQGFVAISSFTPEGSAIEAESALRQVDITHQNHMAGFTLDQLVLVGTLSGLADDDYWVLIQDPNGEVHRLGVADYIGAESAKIDTIGRSKIELLVQVVANDGKIIEQTKVMRLNSQNARLE